MGDLIHSLSSSELTPALEANMIAFWKAYGQGTGGELRESPALMQFISGIPAPLFNGMMGARLAAEQVDAAIEETCRGCIQHQMPALWWVGPDAQPKELGAHLKQHGFENAGTVPGMAINLDKIQETGSLAPGLEVRMVNNASLIRSWAETGWVATGFPEEEASLFAEIEAQIGMDATGLRRRYAGYWNGKLSGTAVLVLNAGVAGIFAVSTLPDARGHGLGTELTAAPLRDARAAGYRVGTLQASEMGYPIYRKLGFQDVCQFNLFLWEKR